MWKLIVVSVAVCICSTFQIYQNAVVNNLYPAAIGWLAQEFGNDSARVDWQWSILAGMTPVGKVFGTMISGEMADRLGRTFSLRIVAFLMIVGGVMVGLCKTLSSIYWATFGRLLIGVSLGVGVNTASLFLTETPPKAYRGRFGSLTQIFFSVGDLAALTLSLPSILGTERLWPLAMAFGCIPAPICLVILLFTPESPRYLMLKSRSMSKKALEAITFFQGPRYTTQTVGDILNETYHLEQSRRVSYLSLFRGATLIPLLLAILINLADQMTGINAIIAYSTLLMEDGGFSFVVASYCTFGLGLIKCSSNLPIPYFLDRFGRKPIIIIGLTGCAISNIIASTAFVYGSPIMVAVGLGLYMVSFSFNSSGICVVTGELFTQQNRGKAMTIAMTCRWTLASFVTLFFVQIVRSASAAWSLVPFIVFSLAAVPVIWRFLPETSNRTFSEITEQGFGESATKEMVGEGTPLVWRSGRKIQQ